ncbi:MAG TPA: lanthionine synthetase LanC family protein, partial [Micromonospora sp.]
ARAELAGLASDAARRPVPPPDDMRARRRAVLALADRPVLRDLSLCHGELGIAAALTALAARGDRDAAWARRRRAGMILGAINRYGATGGTPGGVPTPGLLTGQAGIGYGLLRLGFADRVPSLLLLEPTPAAPRRTPPVADRHP